MVHGPREPLPGRKLERWVHAPVEDRPYWDLELDMPAGLPHNLMILALAPVLQRVAQEAGLGFTSDNSAWYLDPKTGHQKTIFPDILLARAGTDLTRLTAADALFVAEVVTISEKRKERKDTRGQRRWNRYNHVPEFALFFPDEKDPRSLIFHRLVGGRYRATVLSPGGEVSSVWVPGLSFRVKPRAAWSDGHKVDVFYRGELRPPLGGERDRADQERDRAEQERERADLALRRADRLDEEARRAKDEAQRLRDRFRALGLDPDALD